jgi:hypothetical protein
MISSNESPPPIIISTVLSLPCGWGPGTIDELALFGALLRLLSASRCCRSSCEYCVPKNEFMAPTSALRRVLYRRCAAFVVLESWAYWKSASSASGVYHGWDVNTSFDSRSCFSALGGTLGSEQIGLDLCSVSRQRQLCEGAVCGDATITLFGDCGQPCLRASYPSKLTTSCRVERWIWTLRG